MGWFDPKCPYCAGVLSSTGWSAPYPQWRCNRCVSANESQEKIKSLEKRISQLETNGSDGDE